MLHSSSSNCQNATLLIEEEAFGAAAASASAEDDGIEILQVYSREISRRMLDTVKNRAASSASSAVDASAPHTPSPSLEPTTSSAWVCDRPGLLGLGLSISVSTTLGGVVVVAGFWMVEWVTGSGETKKKREMRREKKS
uniref:WPP domain-containing protein n=1 Tax=Fagus sylvatica TaxID=28930 RepID=A0A2N9EF87_FAGSY